MATRKGHVNIEDMTMEFVKANEDAMAYALNRMANDVLRLSKQTVPRKDGALFRSGKKEKDIQKTNALEVYVSYGNERTKASKYAAVQERGYIIGGPTFKKYTTPNTGRNFLANAGQTVAKDSLNYLRQAARKINGGRWTFPEEKGFGT